MLKNHLPFTISVSMKLAFYKIVTDLLMCNRLFLQTDDKGVFGKSLTDEYSIASDTFDLSLKQLWDVSYQTLDYAFISDVERSELQSQWKAWEGQKWSATR